MSKYTVLDFEGVDEKIESDLGVIVQRLCGAFGKNLVSVLLCGGFGRGEGSVINKDGVLRPHNDYDLLLITTSRVSRAVLDELSKELAEKVGIRFVDLGAITRSAFGKMDPSVFVCDLKSSQVVWGEDVLGEAPCVDATLIDLEEARIQLRNRLICFFELTPEAFFKEEKLEEYDRRRFVLQISKAVIASAIGELIEKGEYATSYRQQRSKHKALFGTRDLVSQAYGIKLGVLDPLDVDHVQFYQQARSFFLDRYEILVHDDPFKKTTTSVLSKCKNLIKIVVYKERLVPGHQLRRTERVVELALRNQNREAVRLAELWFKESCAVDDSCALARMCTRLWETYHH